MRLQNVTIKGFKSFANETVIHFNEQIIGIVGPNGSGKSNVVDAVRWVLGEQKSKDLRLEKMVDVIFNGTKSRKKAGMAQVSMTFSNTRHLIPVEYETVKISRILYESGESEYRLNDVPCRLKDIRNLFIDTGIGSNSYAIIELGMVDDILVDKDHARRRMFEQAAGISKYKIRKREAYNKLKNTENDLDRIEDILFELESNLKALEKQARRTARYYVLKEKYKEQSIQLAALNQKDLLERNIQTRKMLETETDKYTELQARVTTQEAELERIKKENLDSEQALSSSQKQFNAIIEGIRKLESEKSITEQNILFARQNISRLEAGIMASTTSMHSTELQLKEKSAALEALDLNTEVLKSTYENRREQHSAIEKRRYAIAEENDLNLSFLKDLEQNKQSLEKEIVQLESALYHSRQNIRFLTDNEQSAHRDFKLLSAECGQLEKEITTIENAIQAKQRESEQLRHQKQVVTDKIAEKKREAGVLDRRIDALENERSLLSDMIENLEGYPESSRFLLKNWKKPAVSFIDILDCDEAYQSAIETYLGRYLTYFVVDDIDQAKSSIDLLRNAQKGKAQFFLLSTFNDFIPQFPHFEKGIRATDVIKTSAKYQKIVERLLGHVFIVEEDDMFNIPNKLQGIDLITSTGSVVRSRNVISGGSVGLFDGKRIGRKKSLEQLEEQIQRTVTSKHQIEQTIQDLESELENLSLDPVKNSILELNERLKNTQIAKAERMTRRDTVKENLDNLSERLSSTRQEILQLEQRAVTIRNELELVFKQVEDRGGSLQEQSDHFNKINKEFAESNQVLNEAQIKWIHHQNALQSLTNEYNFRKQQFDELHLNLSKDTSEKEKVEEQLHNYITELNGLENTLQAEYLKREEEQKKLNEKEQAYFSYRRVINEKEDAVKLNQKALQNQQIHINQLKEKATTIEFELRSVKERLEIEFNLSLSDLDFENATLPDDVDLEELKEKARKLKSRLDNYGEINPMAVDAYNEMLERFDAINVQRNDILKARISLEETIREIDKDATKKFLHSFNKVKDHFKNVFRSLFSDEDDCDLVLFNAENPLESDIEIVAKPKGKRPKILNQLSGGEKTLTATALLFSLYLLKPAPFCVFDEVDAPLDDVNIQKFSQLIRQFSKDSQFIIITHNKSTMASMDVLYGVYMQEQGVSGITQVDFRDYEHEEMFESVNV